MSRIVLSRSAKRRSAAADDYLELVKKFPLRPLRNERDLTTAGRILDEHIGRDDLTPGQRDYLAALLRFVEDFEQHRAADQVKKLTPVELLKHLMEENDMSTTDLGSIVGSRGLASDVLNGNRGLSKTLIVKLARRFRVDPGLFLDLDAAPDSA